VAIALGAAVACVLALEGALLFLNWSAPSPPAATATRPAARPEAQQLRSPFTGLPVPALAPVLAVKIDNIAAARPQTGLGQADIVYVLPVEGGLSRFLAVYSSHIPPVIGPVRSARQEDLPLLRQFGRPAFAYSGAQPQLQQVIDQAPLVTLQAGVVGGYHRRHSRSAPSNLYTHTGQLLAEAHGESQAQDIGFRFGLAPPGGTAAAAWTVSYPAASCTFRWSAKAGRWLLWMDGHPARGTEGGQLRAATVVIQHTRITASPFAELGGPAPFAHSTGAGRAVVLRDGQAWTVHWSRPHGRDGTTFTTGAGQRMTFAPGPVWVVLARR
jgi:Protein of unknown function (DUF3048) N-terminal domain/Protein of unknown function (DUF3048) C-terminal domain